MTEATSPLAPGVVIAETYEIERQLGQGGMGEVWLARHLRLAGKQVAVKVLHVDRQLPQEALARFKREAEIAARLEHPNIVQVLDFNTLPSGQPYLVMEYLKGQSLAARARGKRLPVEQVSTIMLQVGAALQAAHRAGVVHRDLKPENIFLLPTALGDQVKVLDFGISKLSDSNTVQTTDAVLIGTPLYMSPEQALGNNRDVAPQSDLFSLGSICYELFTGQAPFFADNIAKVVFRIAYEKHAPLSSLRADLPASVIAAVEHALEKERDRRTADIDTFVLELTGKALAEVAQDETSGVYKSGMAVTPSMYSGETRSPGSSGRNSQPAAALPPGAKTVSGRAVVISLVVGSLVVAGVVSKVRMDNWAERAAYRASMVDAGYVMRADGTFLTDAGAAAAAPPPDAGEPDAGAALVVVDAGAAEPIAKPRPVELPLTPSETTYLALLDGLARKQDWGTLWDARTKIRLDLKTPSARTRGLFLMVETTCARHDNGQLIPVINELRPLVPSAQLRAARDRCLARYPDAASLDW